MAFKTELCPAYEESQDCPLGTLLPTALFEVAGQLALCTIGSLEGTHTQDAVSFIHSFLTRMALQHLVCCSRLSIAFLCCACLVLCCTRILRDQSTSESSLTPSPHDLTDRPFMPNAKNCAVFWPGDFCEHAHGHEQLRVEAAVLLGKLAADFKTLLCDMWCLQGRCDYGTQCSSAHGVTEMRYDISLSDVDLSWNAC